MTATIKDIAQAACVSRATVSRVLNNSGYVKEETKQKILKIMDELDYIPSDIAKSLSTSKTNTIGVIVPEISNPFFGELIKGISEIATQHDLNIILFDTNNNGDKELKALEILQKQRIQGIILTPTMTESKKNYDYLVKLNNIGIPIVLADGHVKYSNLSGAFIDHVKGGYDATEALIKCGHEKIAIITGSTNSRPAQERLKGYKNALQFYNIPINYDYIFYSDYEYESAYEISKQILEYNDRPTAIFASSNTMVLGCIKALNEYKLRIPEDMSIIGFDKVDVLNIIGMNISFVDGPSLEVGKIVMKMLIEILDNKDNKEIKTVGLSTNLVLKGSEKCLL